MKTLTCVCVVLILLATTAWAQENANYEPRSLASKIGWAFGLSEEEATLEEVFGRMERFCSTTEAPEVCERNLLTCSLGEEHPSDWEWAASLWPMNSALGLPMSRKGDNYQHLWDANKCLRTRMRMEQKLVLACARDATTQWVHKRQWQATWGPIMQNVQQSAHHVIRSWIRVIRVVWWGLFAILIYLSIKLGIQTKAWLKKRRDKE